MAHSQLENSLTDHFTKVDRQLIHESVFLLKAESPFEHSVINGAQVQIALGERDFNTGFPEVKCDFLTNLASDRKQVPHIGNPEVQLEFQRVIAKAKKKGIGLRVG